MKPILDPTLANLARKWYGNYPGPTEDMYLEAISISNYFDNMSVRTAGVVAVARGTDGKLYLGLSPDLQKSVTSAGGWFKFGDDLKAQLGHDFVYCKDVLDHIKEKAKDINPGCAEKKIVSSIGLAGQQLTEICVVPHPDNIWGKDLPALQVAVSQEGALIAPCESCKAIYQPA